MLGDDVGAFVPYTNSVVRWDSRVGLTVSAVLAWRKTIVGAITFGMLEYAVVHFVVYNGQRNTT